MSVELAEPPFPAAADVAIARQPIHDRHARVVGYELLFRGVPGADGRDPLDDERAAATVIAETFAGRGLDAVVGAAAAHVRLTRRFLVDRHALALPVERVVLEVEPPAPRDTAAVEALELLAGQGRRLSLRCDPHGPPPGPALTRLAHSVKLDVGALSPQELAAAADRFGAAAPLLVAAGVDTPALERRCRELGFHCFQGFWFCSPEIVAGQTPPTARLAELRSLAGLYAQTLTFEEFERIIARDVGLSYRLLSYLNSAFFNLPRHVGSVREALMMLGMKAVRRWATLIALSAAEDKPSELTVTALVRARLCELIGRRRPSPTAGADAFFTVGLFSVIDAMMDAPLDQLLAALPLTAEVRAALLGRDGAMGDALAAAVAYERGDLATVAQRLPGLALGAPYLAAVRWADAACGALDAREEESGQAGEEGDGDDDGSSAA